MFRQMDALNKTLLIGAVSFMVLSAFFQYGSAAKIVFTLLYGACFIFFFVRMLFAASPRRVTENSAFLNGWNAVKSFFGGVFHGNAASRAAYESAPRAKPVRAASARKNPKESWQDHRRYKYFLCPQCAQRLRVPRGKGKIRITCTHCGNKFDAKS